MALKFTNPSNDLESEDLKQFEHREVSIEELLIYCSTTQCSDLYIKEYEQPFISRYGKIVKIPCVPTSRDVWMEFQDAGYINNEQNDEYMTSRMLDTAIEVQIPEDNKYYGYNDKYHFRYRVSYGFSEDVRIATFRMIKPEDPSFNSINYPEVCRKALTVGFSHKTGICMLTGATGSGKQLHKETIIPTISGNKKIEDIKNHFKKYASPSNMFALPKEIGDLGEIDAFIEEQK